MKFKIGILLSQGTPIVLEFEDREVFNETLDRLKEKDTTIEIEQGQMAVSIKTSDIIKLVSAWAGKDFDILKHL